MSYSFSVVIFMNECLLTCMNGEVIKKEPEKNLLLRVKINHTSIGNCIVCCGILFITLHRIPITSEANAIGKSASCFSGWLT